MAERPNRPEEEATPMKPAALVKIATLAAAALVAGPRPAPAQGPSAPASIEAINAEHERQVRELEKRRVAAFGKLAGSGPGGASTVAYEACFRLAIERNLYAEADPFALKVIRSEAPDSAVAWLAHVVHIVAEADRGAYDESLKELAAALRLEGPGQEKAKQAGLPVAARASIVDAYFQRLVRADQFEVARQAMKLVADSAEAPAIKALAARRLRQLDLVGKPAPSFAGLDLDGKPFRLEDAGGDVVLVVFWATWCQPNAREMPWLDRLDRLDRAKGLRIVGINLDSAQDGLQELKSVLPQVRRYLLDYNVTWPTLLNGPGELDYAGKFHVAEIPASILIGRDGKVAHLDLSGPSLDKAVAAALARKP